jgi:nucleotide-binding universal stress UspA family protein
MFEQIFDNILLTVDGSGRSREMMNMLLLLPSMERVQVTVLHAIPMQPTAEGVTEYRLAGERILEKEKSSLKLGANNTTVAILKEGDPKDMVCNVAAELKPSLIVMGSRGLGRLRSILENSVSQYVFQLASASMLLVKDDVYIKNIRSVMVAVDESIASEKSLDMAISLIAGLKDVPIYLVRVKKNDQLTADSLLDKVITKAEDKLKRFNIPSKIFARAGDPAKEICKAAAESNASLLIIGSPDRRPTIARGIPDLDRLLGASISDYVRVHATCPVLLTRTQD